MATIFVFVVDFDGVPLTGLSPTFDYWDKASPGAPVATAQAMTELVGGIGGGYFADVTTTVGKEFLAIIDAGATAQSRFSTISFSGDEVKLQELWQIHGLEIANPLVVDGQTPVGSRKVPANGSVIDQAINTVGNLTTVQRS